MRARRSRAPARPDRGVAGARARDSGTNRLASTTASSADRDVDRRTPSASRRCRRARRRRSGPSDMLMPIIAPQMPTACARSRGSSKTLRMIDIATGLSIEPPIACSTRAAISASSVGASAHRRRADREHGQTRSGTRACGRRDRRSSPTASAGSRSSSVYASIVHCSPDTDACSDRWIEGSATLTIVAVEPDDQQAHRADHEHDHALAAVEVHGRRRCGRGHRNDRRVVLP